MKHLIFIACILASCSTTPANNSTNNNQKELVAIDVTKKLPEKTVYVQDIAEIEYIPLETNDSTLINQLNPDAISEQYIVYHNQNGLVLVFNRQGKILYTFNHTGGGPEEYNFINNIVLDEKEKELYITTSELNTKIYVYSMNGNFKRKFVLPQRFTPRRLMDYDKDYLFCYNSHYIDMREDMQGRNMSAEDIRHRDYPYFFISKQTGKITHLNYNTPNRIGNKIYPPTKRDRSKTNGVVHFNIYPLARNTSEILITEFADDTLYSLKSGKLSPIMIKKPSAHKMASPILVGVNLFTDRYIFIDAIEKKTDESSKQFSMIYDKQSNVFYQLNLLNRDNSNKRFIRMGNNIALPHNTGINFMNAEYLLLDYKAGKLQGKLKQIASKLKEDDNPVLMLVKFKE